MLATGDRDVLLWDDTDESGYGAMNMFSSILETLFRCELGTLLRRRRKAMGGRRRRFEARDLSVNSFSPL